MDIQHTLAESLMDQYGCTLEAALKMAVMVCFVDHDISTEGVSWLEFAYWANDCVMDESLSSEFVVRVNELAMEWKKKLSKHDQHAINHALDCMGY